MDDTFKDSYCECVYIVWRKLRKLTESKQERKQTMTKSSAESKRFYPRWLALSPCSPKGGAKQSTLGNYWNQHTLIYSEWCVHMPACVCLCVSLRLCVSATRPLYSNKENSLVDICLETKDKSDNAYRCFNLFSLRRSRSCLSPVFCCVIKSQKKSLQPLPAWFLHLTSCCAVTGRSIICLSLRELRLG